MEVIESSPLMDVNRNRIFDDLDTRIANLSADDVIDVVVTVSSTAPTDFLTPLNQSLGWMNIGFVYNVVPGFSARLRVSQVSGLSKIPWVRQIEWDAPLSLTLDTATRWFGVQKARTDFGVDGDRDGYPTSYSTSDIVIAILDSGIDASHVDLDGGKVLAFHDFVAGRSVPYDDNGHGTHVASIAAGEGQGNPLYRGNAPGAALVVGKVCDVLGFCTTSAVNAGIDWVVANRATYNIRILSMSLTFPGSSDGTDSTSLKANAASDSGIVVTVGAGNKGPGPDTIGSPAAASRVITVGNIADPGEGGFFLHWLSSRGPTKDGRVKPDIVAPGTNIMAAFAIGVSPEWCKTQPVGVYVPCTGTSMATPFVAGTVALMLDANPTLTPAQVKADLATDDWGPYFADNDYGSGRLDGYESVRKETGSGGNPPGVPAHSLYPNHFVGNGAIWSTTIPMSDVSTPIAATLLEEKTCIGLEIRFNEQLVASSHGTNRQDTAGAQASNRGMYEVLVLDDSLLRDCGSQFTLDVSHRQDDWNSFSDAGYSFDTALSVSPTSDAGGYLTADIYDKRDWFRTYVPSDYRIDVSMTPLQARDFDLSLVDPFGSYRATSSRGPGQTESISFVSDVSGDWRVQVYNVGQTVGVYSISLSLTYEPPPPPPPGGGSPFVASWNGTNYVLDNNILPASEAFSRVEMNVVDYYRLHQSLVPKNGRYSLQVAEFEDEHTRLDRVRLLVVDHDRDFRVAVDSMGEIYTFEDPEPPASAVDNYGLDRLGILSVEDGAYYEAWRGDYVDLAFGKVFASDARLLLKADICAACKMSINAYALQNGSWVYMDTVHPRIHFAWEVIDLSGYVPSGDLVIRLSTTRYHKLDFVGLGTSPRHPWYIQEATLSGAVHSETGDVLSLLAGEDGQYVNITPGQQVTIEFDIPDMLEDRRSYILVSYGYYAHKYQPYGGEDLAIDGLNLQASAFLPEATPVFWWDVDITELRWDFGDGSTATGVTVAHAYGRPGEFFLAVEVSYADGTVKRYGRIIILSG